MTKGAILYDGEYPLFSLSSAGQSTPVLRRDRFCMCKSGRKTHEGPRPLNPAIESLTIG